MTFYLVDACEEVGQKDVICCDVFKSNKDMGAFGSTVTVYEPNKEAK